MNKTFVVLFAGGIGVRMNSKALPKQFIELHGKPIIIHTIEHFEKNNNIDGIIIVMNCDWINYTKDLVNKFNLKKIKSIIPGGISGQQSIYNGLNEAQKFYSPNDIVLIHDGVRPLITQELINENIELVNEKGNAISCSKMVETVILKKDSLIQTIVDRDKAFNAKAPQSFFFGDIFKAHNQAINDNKNDFIDSCSLMMHYGYKLNIVECSSENIKITTPIDFYLFRAIFEKNENSQIL